jgi:hypothetical protein
VKRGMGVIEVRPKGYIDGSGSDHGGRDEH